VVGGSEALARDSGNHPTLLDDPRKRVSMSVRTYFDHGYHLSPPHVFLKPKQPENGTSEESALGRSHFASTLPSAEATGSQIFGETLFHHHGPCPAGRLPAGNEVHPEIAAILVANVRDVFSALDVFKVAVFGNQAGHPYIVAGTALSIFRIPRHE